MQFNGVVSGAAILSAIAASTADAGVMALTIRAMIDGRDQLVLRGGTAQWHHLDYAAVGRHDGLDEPTYFTLDLNGYRLMNAFAWTPAWSTAAPDEIRREEWSSVFGGLAVSLPREEQTLALSNVTARSSTSIIQAPTAENQYTTIIEFDDNAPGGHDWYEITLTYSFASVPAPSAALTLAIGLFLRRRREEQ